MGWENGKINHSYLVQSILKSVISHVGYTLEDIMNREEYFDYLFSCQMYLCKKGNRRRNQHKINISYNNMNATLLKLTTVYSRYI